MDKKKVNVPKIRFPGFVGEWEENKFSKTFIFLQNNSLSRADLNYERGFMKNVHYGDVLIKFGEILDVEKEKIPFVSAKNLKVNSTSLLENGDIIIADAAEDETVGKCSEIKGINGMSVVSGLHTIPCRPMKKFAAGYLGYYMNSTAYHNQLLPLIQGTKISSISKSALQSTSIVYPRSEDEQRRIGEFFHKLDNLIAIHQSKLNNLQVKKKGLLQKMFPQDGEAVPKFRFPGFTNAWEQRKLEEIMDNYEDPVTMPRHGYMRLGIRSHAKGTFHSYVTKGEELETAKMHRVADGKFIVNITFGWEHAVAITNENDSGKLVSHRFPQFQFHEELKPGFFKYVILDKKFKYHLCLASPGGAGRNRVLNIGEMLKYKILFPSGEEQQKIACFFNNFDNLISLHQRKLTHLQEQKKALLQQMFL